MARLGPAQPLTLKSPVSIPRSCHLPEKRDQGTCNIKCITFWGLCSVSRVSHRVLSAASFKHESSEPLSSWRCPCLGAFSENKTHTACAGCGIWPAVQPGMRFPSAHLSSGQPWARLMALRIFFAFPIRRAANNWLCPLGPPQPHRGQGAVPALSPGSHPGWLVLLAPLSSAVIAGAGGVCSPESGGFGQGAF